MFQSQNTGKHLCHKQLCLTIPPMLYVNLTNQMLSMIFKLTSQLVRLWPRPGLLTPDPLALSSLSGEFCGFETRPSMVWSPAADVGFCAYVTQRYRDLRAMSTSHL